MREHVLAEHEGREVIRYKEVRCPLCQKTVQQYSLRKHFINAHQYSKEEAQAFYHQFYPKQVTSIKSTSSVCETGHRSPIYADCQTQSAKGLALT